MKVSTVRQTTKDLAAGFGRKFSDIDSLGLLAGTSCSFAFIGYVFFAPAMTHVSPLILSYTDAAYVLGALTSAVLLINMRRGRPIGTPITLLKVISLCVLISFLAYTYLFEFWQVGSPLAMDLICGAVFGVYLPLATSSWLRVHATYRISDVVWNVLLSALFGSFGMWLLSGMTSPQLVVALAVALIIGTGSLIARLRALALPTAPALGDGTGRTLVYLFAAVFLFSFAFMVAISFAQFEGAAATYATPAFFAPFLLVCVLLLSLKSFTAVSLLNIAVPAVATATIAASFLRMDPIATFDLAVMGLFFFLVYVVVLVCAETKGDTRRSYRAFLLLMLSFAGGCIVGRMSLAICTLVENMSSDITVLLAILATIGAMILCMRNGIVPRQLGELFRYDENPNGRIGLLRTQMDEVDRVAHERNLGNREKEVLVLLLRGKTASEIAAELVVASGTAKSHIRHVYKKLGVHSRAELFDLFALEHA